MVQIALDCPHCKTVHAAFAGDAYKLCKPGSHDYIMLTQCQVCGDGITAKFYGLHFTNWIAGAAQGDVQLRATWPESITAEAPVYVPDNVGRFYLQGMDSLARQNFDAAGAMFRKSLDTGLKRIHPEGKGTLQGRIDKLPESTGVTPAMKEWAHQIRHLGNDAAHEEEPFTEKEAISLQSFTELFLTYAFTLPGMVAAGKPTLEEVPPTAT